MANDVYIQFGIDTDPGDDASGYPAGTDENRMPDIQGDSTDATHWWWCELRACGFDMQCPQQEDPNAASPTKTVQSTFKSVTLTKRVDWASTQLFQACYQAAMNSIGRPILISGKPQTGIIEDVFVEVCRPAGGVKVACASAHYSNVRIIKYGISLSGPEPAEAVTFEFDKVRFCYFQTDPYTGELLDPGGVCTDVMENHHPTDQTSTGTTSGTDAAGGDGATSAGTGSGGGTPSPVAAPASAGGAPPAPGSAPDPTITVNFPGLWQGTGFGLLPD